MKRAEWDNDDEYRLLFKRRHLVEKMLADINSDATFSGPTMTTILLLHFHMDNAPLEELRRIRRLIGEKLHIKKWSRAETGYHSTDVKWVAIGRLDDEDLHIFLYTSKVDLPKSCKLVPVKRTVTEYKVECAR